MMAFQVFDPQKAGIADESFSPKSGKQMLISVAALSGENDDWLITPELAQDCRYVSFYAKSITDRYGLEQFEAWYSTSGTDTDDFTKFETGTQEAPAEVKSVEETSAGTPPADEGGSENNAAAPQSTQTSPADAAQQSAAPTAEAPGEAAAETHNEEAAAALSSNDQRAIERREEAPLEAPAEPPAQSSALSGLIFSEAHAEPAATQNASNAADSIFTTFDPSKSAGLLSSTGTITISTANRYVMFENLNFSGEFFYNKTHYTAVAKADVIRFKGEELSGMNATASLSRPQEVSGDLHFGAVDFRLRPGIFESPEMRVAHSFMEDGRTTSLEISSTVRADLV